MTWVRRFAVLLVVCLCLLAVAPVDGAWQSSTYTISVPGSIDTPTRTVSLEGDEFEVGAVGRVTPGEQLVADVSAPADVEYDVYLYDADKEIKSVASGTGESTVNFDTEGLESGSYVLAVYVDGTFETIHPVVVAGYSLRLDAPVSGDEGTEVAVSITLTSVGSSGSPNRVEVVLIDGQFDRRTTATLDGDTYRASISLADVPTGTYQVYAVARGDDRAYGRTELVGISDTRQLEVHSATDDSDGGSGGGSGASTSTTTTDGTTTSVNDTTTTDGTTTPANDTTTTDGTTTPANETTTPESTTPESSSTTTPTPSTTDPAQIASSTESTTSTDAVITPNDSTVTTTDGQPGFTIAIAMVALLSATVLALRFRRL